MPVNIEIKARCSNPAEASAMLQKLGAVSKGIDHQVDTYFKVDDGRLKLREGNIENNLIYYKRDNQDGPKKSDVILYPAGQQPGLKQILTETLGVRIVVDKKREIFFIDNVKFHVDNVENLGSFIEIEAIGEDDDEEKLDEQCKHYMRVMNILEEHLVSVSYSDLLLEKNES